MREGGHVHGQNEEEEEEHEPQPGGRGEVAYNCAAVCCCWRSSRSSLPGSPWTSCTTCNFGSTDDAAYGLSTRGPPPISPNILSGIWGHGLAGEALPL
jgi:hypothetical protein